MDVDGILARAASSLRMEGLEPTWAGYMYTRLYLEGNMSADDAIRAIIESHGLACGEHGSERDDGPDRTTTDDVMG